MATSSPLAYKIPAVDFTLLTEIDGLSHQISRLTFLAAITTNALEYEGYRTMMLELAEDIQQTITLLTPIGKK